MTTHLPLTRLAALLLPFASFACSGAGAPVDAQASAGEDALSSRDACTAPALAAAETEYGNDPVRTHVKTLVKSVKYRVTVGIGNAEDGPVDYYVTFPSGCRSTPNVTEVPSLPHPLRDAVHAAYGAIFTKNGNAMDPKYGIDSDGLPEAPWKQYQTWMKNGPDTCTSVDAYEVTVSGQQTFAVTCAVAHDSIKLSVVITDASGADIDMAALYSDRGVGVDGVSWQNETFLQQD
jgi:hypothetical protein